MLKQLKRKFKKEKELINKIKQSTKEAMVLEYLQEIFPQEIGERIHVNFNPFILTYLDKNYNSKKVYAYKENTYKDALKILFKLDRDKEEILKGFEEVHNEN